MKFTDLDEAYRLRHRVLYLEEMWSWARDVFEIDAVGNEDTVVRLTPAISGQEFGPLIVSETELKGIVRALYGPAILRLREIGVDAAGLHELMSDEMDFGKVSAKQKKEWAARIWQQGRDQNFWLMKFSPNDLFIIERPGNRKLRWLRDISPKGWTADQSKALRLPRDQADQVARDLGNVVTHLVEPASQDDPGVT